MVETRPNVRGRTTQLGDPPGAPIKRGINALALVEEPASQRCGEGKEQNARDLNMDMKGTAFAPARVSGRCREGQLEDRSRDGGGPVPQSGESLPNPDRSPKLGINISRRKEGDFGSGRVPGHQINKP
jgi:hypothetical protein